MLLDVLSGLPELKLGIGYDLDGERITHFPSDSYDLERCQPIYETMPGWSEDITKVKTLAGLPTAARRYVDRIGEMVGKKISFVSIGPDRDQTIHLS